MVAVSVKRSMVLFGVRGMAIGAIIRGLVAHFRAAGAVY
jgi:hypothetical protein